MNADFGLVTVITKAWISDLTAALSLERFEQPLPHILIFCRDGAGPTAHSRSVLIKNPLPREDILNKINELRLLFSKKGYCYSHLNTFEPPVTLRNSRRIVSFCVASIRKCSSSRVVRLRPHLVDA